MRIVQYIPSEIAYVDVIFTWYYAIEAGKAVEKI